MTTCPTNRRNEVEKGLFKRGNSSVLVKEIVNDHLRDAAALVLPHNLFVSSLYKMRVYMQ
jgi:hypothetical protein